MNSENEKLRALLRDLMPVATENGYYWLAARIEFALSRQAEQALPAGFRVMKPTSAILRDGDRWEIYAPCGSGGIVHEDDVTDWVVRRLLDALAAQGGDV